MIRIVNDIGFFLLFSFGDDIKVWGKLIDFKIIKIWGYFGEKGDIFFLLLVIFNKKRIRDMYRG